MWRFAFLAVVAWAVPVEDDRIVSWTQERVKAWQPTSEERAFDKIGWARDIRDALRLAKANNRPVFLFTHTGRINTGRC
jgi:hypothetical protein